VRIGGEYDKKQWNGRHCFGRDIWSACVLRLSFRWLSVEARQCGKNCAADSWTSNRSETAQRPSFIIETCASYRESMSKDLSV